jgi:hypothetical protein
MSFFFSAKVTPAFLQHELRLFLAMFIHNGLVGSFSCGRSLNFIKLSKFTSTEFFEYRENALGAVYIYPRSSTRSDAENSLMLSHMQHDVSEAQSESQHMLWWGTCAHLDNLPDHFPEGHVAVLSRFSEPGTTCLGQYKDRANTAG